MGLISELADLVMIIGPFSVLGYSGSCVYSIEKKKYIKEMQPVKLKTEFYSCVNIDLIAVQ